MTEQNAKTVKGEALGFLTGILYFAPHKRSGKNVCPYATPGCIDACLYTAGRGVFDSVQAARLRKTESFFRDRDAFILQLHSDVARFAGRATRKGMKPVVRLNGTSDLRWELLAPSLFASFPDVQFYDYTKDSERFNAWMYRARIAGSVMTPAGLRYPQIEWPRNYHLTFSASERTTPGDIRYLLANGGTVTLVTTAGAKTPLKALAPFFPESLPYWKYPAVDGDAHDLRFLDAPGSLVLLRPKGRARKDTTGFVWRPGMVMMGGSV